MNLQILFTAFVLALLLGSCDTNNTNADSEDFTLTDSAIAPEALDISKESMGELIDNVSSPIEIASLLIEQNVPFDKSYIANTDNIDNLVSNFDCAINIGILGTDLGYLNLYEKTSSVMSTVAGINELATKLKVGQFFDFTMLKRLASSADNLDSLIYTSIASFNNMDDYLRSNNRTNVSALIVSGVWIESTSLATMVYKEHANKKIAERIGEQKLILNNLVLIIANYKSDPNFAALLVDLKDLKVVFDDIKITSVEGDAESVVENGMLIIRQTSVSTVHITDEQIETIRLKVEVLRNKLINNNINA